MVDIVENAYAMATAVEARAIAPGSAARLIRGLAAEIERLRSAPAGRMAEALTVAADQLDDVAGHFAEIGNQGLAADFQHFAKYARSALTAWEAKPEAGRDAVIEEAIKAARDAAEPFLTGRSSYVLHGPGGMVGAMVNAIRALKSTPSTAGGDGRERSEPDHNTGEKK